MTNPIAVLIVLFLTVGMISLGYSLFMLMFGSETRSFDELWMILGVFLLAFGFLLMSVLGG